MMYVNKIILFAVIFYPFILFGQTGIQGNGNKNNNIDQRTFNITEQGYNYKKEFEELYTLIVKQLKINKEQLTISKKTYTAINQKNDFRNDNIKYLDSITEVNVKLNFLIDSLQQAGKLDSISLNTAIKIKQQIIDKIEDLDILFDKIDVSKIMNYNIPIDELKKSKMTFKYPPVNGISRYFLSDQQYTFRYNGGKKITGIGTYPYAEDFSCGLALVKDKEGLFYYIDTNGMNKFNKTFISATSFYNNIAYVNEKTQYSTSSIYILTTKGSLKNIKGSQNYHAKQVFGDLNKIVVKNGPYKIFNLSGKRINNNYYYSYFNANNLLYMSSGSDEIVTGNYKYDIYSKGDLPNYTIETKNERIYSVFSNGFLLMIHQIDSDSTGYDSEWDFGYYHISSPKKEYFGLQDENRKIAYTIFDKIELQDNNTFKLLKDGVEFIIDGNFPNDCVKNKKKFLQINKAN